MTSWSFGYVSDIPYTYGFYRELTPSILSFAALLQGKMNVQEIKSYCELGCGHGLSTNLLAAANPKINFYATDFNPEHIAGARALASAAGTPNVAFFDEAFVDFLDNPKLPADGFDVIALHGIYSWVDSNNRQAIIDFIRRHLKVGGTAYISYNCFPGWASGAPLQRLLSDQASITNGSSVERIKAALEFAEKLKEISGFFNANPQAKGRLKDIKKKSPAYLAHEYLNQNWYPFYFSDVVADMERAKLTFLCSANILDSVDGINLNKEQQAFLASETDRIRKEGLRDFIVNQQFRKDIFVKGSLSHTQLSARQAWMDLRFVLSTRRDKVPMKVSSALGEVNLQEKVYAPILDVLANGPISVKDLIADNTIAVLGLRRVLEALAVLLGIGHVELALSANEESTRKKRTAALNVIICDQAKTSGEIQYLASPVTGGGILVNRFDQLFLAAHLNKDGDPVGTIWSSLKMQEQKLNKDGKALHKEEDNITELKRLFSEFKEKTLPVLSRLGIAW